MKSICRRQVLLRVQSVAIALLLSSASAFAQSSLPAVATISQAESQKIDDFLKAFYSGIAVTKITTNSFGQMLSCVDVQHQPALNSPAMKGHQVQLQPSAELKAILGSVKEDDDTISPCPKGSVGMIVPTREQMVRAGSVNKFLSKYPDGFRGRFGRGPSDIQPPSITGHEYATYIQYVNSIAAQSTINVWQSAVESWWAGAGEMSLSQLWISGGTGNATQTVEVGSNVNPLLYGDFYPHLFIYWTADYYGTTGCYNLLCGSFVQTSNIMTIGGALPSSTLGGAQVEGSVAFYRDPATGNWILFYFDGVNYIQSGYYPMTLFGSGQMSQYAQRIEFGGEIYNANSVRHTATDMGSGQDRYAGYGYAAYQRNLKYMDTNSVVHDFQPTNQNITNPNCYNSYWNTDSTWGTLMYFGGTGYSSICP